MNLALELKIALRYLFNRTDEGFISLISIFSFLGITLGVATLIIVMSVMNGFREKLIDNLIGTNGHINITSSNGTIKNAKELVRRIDISRDEFKDNYLYVIKPVVIGQGLVNYENNSAGALIIGINNNDELFAKSAYDQKYIYDNVKWGSKDLISTGMSLIGVRMAENLGIKPGDTIDLLSSKSVNSIIGDIPRNKEYIVSGVFETGVYEFDNMAVYIPFNEAQAFFNLSDDEATKIEITTKDPDQSGISKKILHELYLNLEWSQEWPGLIIRDWQETNSHYIGALRTEKNVMFLILSMIILVAALNIISGLVMLVYEKQKSIATLRSMGMKGISIMRIFIMCGLTIGMSGIVLGSSIGILFVMNINNIKVFFETYLGFEIFNPVIYLFRDIPAHLNLKDIVWTIVFTIIITILASIFPAIKAARKDPSSVLKYF